MSTTSPQSAANLHDELGTHLRTGVWPMGTRLSTRELGRRFNAHRATVQRALRRLEKQGLVECRPRSGWYVLENESDRLGARNSKQIKPVEGMIVGMIMAVDDGANAFGGISWSSKIFHSLRERLAASQVDLLVWSHDVERENHAQYFERRITDFKSNLLGVVSLNPLDLAPLEPFLDEHEVKWVTTNRRPSTLHNFISADNTRTGRTIGRLFAMMGWSRIAMMAGALELFPSESEKFQGICSGYAEVTGALPESLQVIEAGGSTKQVGFDAMTKHLQTNRAPQAVFCAGDDLAIGSIRACQEHGLDVPNNVAILGNSGFEEGEHITPSLTTYSQPMVQLGQGLADMLLQMHQQQTLRVPGRTVDGELIFRDSLTIPSDVRAELERWLADTDDTALSHSFHSSRNTLSAGATS